MSGVPDGAVAVRIRLLGRPCLEGAGELKGAKPWAVMARVLLAERPLSRRELAAELFPDAADPLGALRWSLASIRRALGAPDSFAGDPVVADLPAGSTVDALDVLDGRIDAAEAGELLDEIDPDVGPEFATWLLVTRRQIAARFDALLHDEIIRALSRGRVERGVELAGVAVRRSPFDERAHVLFVRALVAAGDPEAALDHVIEAERLFRAELGCDPSPALRSAARGSIADAMPGVSASKVSASLLDAGRAAITAGALDAGIDCLRRAAATAEEAADDAQKARCLVALGSALVHAVRGFDDEASIMLDEAAHLARVVGDRDVAVEALRERGYVDALAGRRPEAQTYLDLARDVAGGHPGLVAGIDAVAGLNLTDWGRLDEGIHCFESAIEHGLRAGDERRVAWAEGVGGWSLWMSGRREDGVGWLSSALDRSRAIRWVAFEPWPLATLAEAGDPQAIEDIERCFALSCQLEDPCWEGASARSLALLHSQRGDHESALRWIVDARRRSARKSDVWVRVVGEILLTEAELRLVAGDASGAHDAARELVGLAARKQLDDVLRRGLVVLDASRS